MLGTHLQRLLHMDYIGFKIDAANIRFFRIVYFDRDLLTDAKACLQSK